MSPPDAGVDRATFMARVRAALDRDDERPDSVDALDPPDVDDALVRRVHVDADLLGRFHDEATAAGMQVRPTTMNALGAAVASVLSDHACRRSVVSIADESVAGIARGGVAAANTEIIDWREAPGLTRHYEADAGITDVVAAVAETGSIVIASGAARSRGAFLVPPVHVAIVPASVIVPDLLDLLSTPSSGIPAATIIVTGPSKTADIEGILITGVHGPKAVEILLIEDA